MPWWIAFVLTLVVEVPLWVWLLDAGGFGRRVILALGVNAVTHPTLWWVAGGGVEGSVLVLMEVLIAVLEGVAAQLVCRPGWRVALLTSTAANAASVLVGLLLMMWGSFAA